MGRGLSTLQRTILRLALTNRARGVQGVHVTYAEVLTAHWGWTPVGRLRFAEGHELAGSPDSGHLFRGVPPAERNRAYAALSRSMRRLEQRGLVTVWGGEDARWTGVHLTAAGTRAAEQLVSE